MDIIKNQDATLEQTEEKVTAENEVKQEGMKNDNPALQATVAPSETKKAHGCGITYTGDDEHDGLVRILNGKHTLVNQLQFLCHQLRAETRHLARLYNKIIFPKSKHEIAIPKCAIFLISLVPQLIAGIRIVAIKHTRFYLGQSISKLLDICRANAGIQIHAHICTGVESAATMMNFILPLAYFYAQRLRKDISIRKMMSSWVLNTIDVTYQELVAKIQGPKSYYCLDNFRVLLWYGELDYDAIRHAVIKQDWLLPGMPAGEDSLDCFMAFVKEFVEQGF